MHTDGLNTRRRHWVQGKIWAAPKLYLMVVVTFSASQHEGPTVRDHLKYLTRVSRLLVTVGKGDWRRARHTLLAELNSWEKVKLLNQTNDWIR